MLHTTRNHTGAKAAVKAANKIKQLKDAFEAHKRIYESALLTFKGVDGFDVYNCSVPFSYKEKRYIYGRVEKRAEWANSHVRLFEETGKDEYTAVPEMKWGLEDPYIAKINGEMIFGGTHVRKEKGEVSSYYGYFFRGTPMDLTYFTSGPEKMKDIRTVQLQDGRVGLFSRPRSDTHSSVGFTVLNKVDELCAATVLRAEALDLVEDGTWGGVNQPYLLSSGKIGCIAHFGYDDSDAGGAPLTVYVNASFVVDPGTRHVEDVRVIGTMSCYPACAPKLPRLADCVFVSGLEMRKDGKCDLYSGLGDAHEGRITIDYPFEGHGTIVGKMIFAPPSSL